MPGPDIDEMPTAEEDAQANRADPERLKLRRKIISDIGHLLVLAQTDAPTVFIQQRAELLLKRCNTLRAKNPLAIESVSACTVEHYVPAQRE
ncbi:MAG: hypothetical protein JWN89_512 [Parcubacteria group bacterium]|nr:hypothetical protein [Parcubacteria group bacterium]